MEHFSFLVPLLPWTHLQIIYFLRQLDYKFKKNYQSYKVYFHFVS